MYPSKGGNPYVQQPFASQQAYGQIGNPDGGASRQSLMGGTQEADMSGYRAHTSQVPQYSGAYASVYGSAALSSQQVAGASGKGAVSSSLQAQTGYPSDSSKFLTGTLGSSMGMIGDDYLSGSNRGYSQKADQFSALKNSDYASRQYGELQGAVYNDPAARKYSELHDRMDQVALLRQQQMLKGHALQSGPDMRQADYHAARSAPIHSGPQELSSYGGRMDVDPRSLSLLAGAGVGAYGGQRSASILGGPPRRNADDLAYAQGLSGAGYGVSLPPGRDYVAGKSMRGPSFESDYQGSVVSHGHQSLGVSMLEDRHDDRSSYRRELEKRELEKRDDDRRRELLREREREREREERAREREREREKERLRELRDKERERDRKRASDSRRERTPPRVTKDRRGSSLTRSDKPSRRPSPRRESVHRHRSPVKEKKREYICKVYPFCLVDVERDYLSLNKRYPRLSISPDCSKVVFNWPKERLNLSLHTPVSFEHDFLEVDNKIGEKGSVTLVDELSNSKCGSTIWNAKVVLMSGISGDALEELSSEKVSEKKIIHLNNILKFVVIRKDHSFMAVGGQWDAKLDGGDPAADDSSLIQTAQRSVKDLTQLDLQNCVNWNRFVEIHYNRVGKDGLFSHKEITVLFLPDLSGCLPTMELWRSQWLAHMKDVSERERTSKLKKSMEKKEAVKGEKSNSKTEKGTTEKVKSEDIVAKDGKAEKTDLGGPLEKKSESKIDMQSKNDPTGSAKGGVEQKGKSPSDEKQADGSGGPLEKKTESKIDIQSKNDPTGSAKGGVKQKGKSPSDEKQADGKVEGDLVPGNKSVEGANGGASDPPVETKKPVKKKIVKKKMLAKKAVAEDVSKLYKVGDDQQDTQDTAVQKDASSASPANVKTFVRKKVIKKVPIKPSPQKDDETVDNAAIQPEKISEKEYELPEDGAKEKQADGSAAVQTTGPKTTGKKKIIRRIVKRKVSVTEEKDTNTTCKKDVHDNVVMSVEGKKEGDTNDQAVKKDVEPVVLNDSGNKIAEDSKMLVDEMESKSEKQTNDEGKDKNEDKSDDASPAEKSGSKNRVETEVGRKDDSKKDVQDRKDKPKDEKQKSKDSKSESKHKSHKEVKERGSPEQPPRHPGLFLQTKQPKDSKSRIRSMALSLDGLLDYNDKDIEESTFELSVFAESLNEMLQYEMGSRILSFLEKLRKRYIVQKNLRKRQRDENPDKENEKEKASTKRPKIQDEAPVEKYSLESQSQDDSNMNIDGKKMDDPPVPGTVESKTEDKADDDILDEGKDEDEAEDEDEEEDPEEIIEDDQEMDEAAPSVDETEEEKREDKTDLPEAGDGKDKDKANEKRSVKTAENDENPEKDEKPETGDSEAKRPEKEKPESPKKVVIDKELLQAFRFFDQNQVGYIKVEDLRGILHNLGKLLSNRDIKDMVHTSLLESNSSARDNRIMYMKLARLADI